MLKVGFGRVSSSKTLEKKSLLTGLQSSLEVRVPFFRMRMISSGFKKFGNLPLFVDSMKQFPICH